MIKLTFISIIILLLLSYSVYALAPKTIYRNYSAISTELENYILKNCFFSKHWDFEKLYDFDMLIPSGHDDTDFDDYPFKIVPNFVYRALRIKISEIENIIINGLEIEKSRYKGKVFFDKNPFRALSWIKHIANTRPEVKDEFIVILVFFEEPKDTTYYGYEGYTTIDVSADKIHKLYILDHTNRKFNDIWNYKINNDMIANVKKTKQLVSKHTPISQRNYFLSKIFRFCKNITNNST